MRIPGKATIAACERLLLELDSGKRASPLTIPTRLKHTAAGGEAAVLQFLITWAQRQADPTCKTFATSPEDAQVSKISKRLHGLVAILSSNKVLNTQGKDLFASFRRAAISSLDQLQGNDPQSATRSTSIEVMAADHLGRSAPLFLYFPSCSPARNIRPRDHYVRLAHYLVQKTVSNQSLLKKPADDTVRAIGNLLYELFKNTHDHARSDVNGRRLSVSYRLFQASTITPKKNDFNKIASDFPPLLDFCARLETRKEDEFVNIFTLSVIDSGPGYAQTWTGKELWTLAQDEELSATIDCFSKGSTTKRHDRFGHGLHLVRSIMRAENGFFRLRTGRLSLHYDAVDDFGHLSSTIPLRSWKPEDQSLAPASGTLLTLFVPLTHI